MREAHSSGLPLMRPMFLHYADHPDSETDTDKDTDKNKVTETDISSRKAKASSKSTSAVEPVVANIWNMKEQFMFGPDFLVTPCMHEGATNVTVFFPEQSGNNSFTRRFVFAQFFVILFIVFLLSFSQISVTG